MSDRSYVEFHFREEDREKLIEAMGLGEGEYENSAPGLWTDCEVNYGGEEALRDAAEAGFTFHGYSGAGVAYGPMVFAAHAGEYQWCDANMDGEPVVACDSAGEFCPDGLKRLRRYVALLAKVKQHIGYTGGE